MIDPRIDDLFRKIGKIERKISVIVEHLSRYDMEETWIEQQIREIEEE